ncbi:MAG: glycoside hydrolase family 57 [Rhizomicrobium sp.]
MNAPLLQRDARNGDATLQLFALFHLNIAFSSIEEEQRDEVIARCYWPLLELAKVHGPIGVEATGLTLEEIAARDPLWCAEARRLVADGRIEPIGSGYAQIIGPLVPARVTQANLRIGHEIYERVLGQRPSLALVNEQAYSAGLVGLYLDAGYRAILMDWDNPAAHHPEWPAETRYRPQRAAGACGRSIALLWTNTVAFQKLQRFAHGDIAIEDYVGYVDQQRSAIPRSLCLYASDAEIFDFRPGRYRTEETLGGESEWVRIGRAFAVLAATGATRLVAPGAVLAAGSNDQETPLRLESAACPVPVKKQRKYNLSRWAVTGRDDLGINAACERIYRGIDRTDAGDDAWKELCYLWSSDFRTHITEHRWTQFCARLTRAEARWAARGNDLIQTCHPRRARTQFARGKGTQVAEAHDIEENYAESVLDPSRPSDGPGSPSPRFATLARPGMTIGVCEDEIQTLTARHIDIETPALGARLDRRRGLAIESLRFAGDTCATIGGLAHGHFDDIALQADWYTGDCVFEAPGEHKITDLEWCETRLCRRPDGAVVVAARIETPKGVIAKTMRFSGHEPRVDFDLLFDWENWDRGSLRLGHITLLPDAFDWERLSLTTHNGGKDWETFLLRDSTVDHGAPVSFLVSSSHGIGMTEGWAELGDAATRIRVEVDRQTAPLLGLLIHRRIGGSLFCQLALSALELDETRKPQPYRAGPRRFRFSLIRSAASVHC